ncbi:hypothetical protein L0668_17290 [Paraglaciecola aquimarina]|uniref:Phytase-like domain-containing protein n=1 Tax=Paraglaciecola algarum TaxID=3050085 RepID=A0ABS9DC03_9ALTE|nr:hypothetical protein [Paraglaciecola sp. G1-23]MCF2949877.1 hypothetical protein [Paraglaciecola sp. G1-23]
MIFRVLGSLTVSLLITFNSHAKVKTTPNYKVLEVLPLPQEILETSGLYCPQTNQAFTINDSGNKPIIYTLDQNGQIVSQRKVDTKMRDWEALTGDQTHFFIGDVGNNNGKRKAVQIHALPKEQGSSKVTTSMISYQHNSVKKNENLNHDFDAEALVNQGDNLFLFSKSWQTGVLHIYKLNKDQPKQNVAPISSIEDLPGIITGGDYDKQNNRFILVGYELKGLGSFYPFITILNAQLDLVKSFYVPGFDQVEGLCVTPNGEIWFTQENGFFSSPKLVKLELNI